MITINLLLQLRLAARSLSRRPGFALAAVVVLALGLGVNSTLYAFLETVMLSPMPGVERGRELVWVTMALPGQGRAGGLSHPDYLDFRAGTTDVFTALAAYSATPFALGSGERGQAPERVRGQMVSADYFATLGVSPARGRFFLPAEDTAAGAAEVVVISDRLWRSRFGGSAAVLEQALRLNGRDFAVVGVAPPGFRGPELGASADLWVPLSAAATAQPGDPRLLEERGSSWLAVLGRLAPGVAPERAQAALSAIEVRLAQAYPEEHQGKQVRLSPAQGGLSPSGQKDLGPLAVLAAVVAALMLLLVCSNVANLLLARALGRGREVRIRLALGAPRSRLIAEQMAESLLLALAAGALALLLAAWAGDFLLAALPRQEFDGLEAAAGPRWLGATALLALAAGALAGLAPALAATRQPVTAGALAAGERSRGPRRLPGRLVVAQLALSLALLTTAATSLRVIGRAGAADLGFEPEGVVALSFDLELQGYPPAEREVFRRQLLERAAALPGLRSASLANLAPLSGMMVGGWASRGDAADPDEEGMLAFRGGVAPGYFGTLGIPLLSGRDFERRDREGETPVVILNRTAAERLFGDANAVGQRVRLDGRDGRLVEVIGVAADSALDESTEDPRPFTYLPLAQESVLGRTTLLARVDGDTGAALTALQAEIRALDANLPVFEATTLPAIARDRIDKQRGISLLLSAFGVLGLALAAVGLFGLMSQLVARRQKELGVRIALGAGAASLKRLILGDSLRLAAFGAGFGLLLSLAAVPVLAQALGTFSPTDLVAFLGALALLAATAVATSWWPTKKALATDPVVVLREE